LKKYLSPKIQQLLEMEQSPSSWSTTEILAVLGAAVVVMALLFFWAAYVRKSKRRSTSRSLGSDHLPKPILRSGERKRKRRRRWKNRNPTLSQTGGLPPNRDDNTFSDPG